MILSDRDILAAMRRERDPLVIDPPVPDHAIQPASLDITLGNEFAGRDGDGDEGGHIARHPGRRWVRRVTDEDRFPHFTLHPDRFVLAGTAQKVTIPADLCAQLSGKSGLGRLGLLIHVTAGFIDPGFRGHITLELRNLSRIAIRLTPGMPIGQLVFTKLTSPAMRPYGSDGLGSHYQNQVGATRSYLDTSN